MNVFDNKYCIHSENSIILYQCTGCFLFLFWHARKNIPRENMQSRQEIVLFKSSRNSERRNKGNIRSKSNSNKIKLCGGGGQHYLILNKISTL